MVLQSARKSDKMEEPAMETNVNTLSEQKHASLLRIQKGSTVGRSKSIGFSKVARNSAATEGNSQKVP